MKRLLISAGILFFLSGFKNVVPPDELCQKNEEVILSFVLKDSKKSVCLCKEKTGRYMVYRFGRRDKIELAYPQKLDVTSWKAFILKGQKRFGGKANAGFVDYKLTFQNKGVKYELFEDSSDEDASKEVGIKVIVAGKETILKGSNKTKKGTLLRLDDESEKIKNTGYEE